MESSGGSSQPAAEMARGSSWKDSSGNSSLCSSSSFSVGAGRGGLGLRDFSSHHFCLVKWVVAQRNPNTKSSHPTLRHLAGGGEATWGEFNKRACFLIGMCFVIWALRPFAALGRCRAVLPRTGLYHCAAGRPLASRRGGGDTLVVLMEALPSQPHRHGRHLAVGQPGVPSRSAVSCISVEKRSGTERCGDVPASHCTLCSVAVGVTGPWVVSSTDTGLFIAILGIGHGTWALLTCV